MRRDKPLVVTVTAPKGGPGKTMVSMLLGYAAARMGLRVLVVGCGIANDEHTDRAKLMLTQAAGRVPTLRDRPYPQQWWRDPVTGYQVVPAARAKLDRQRDIVLADVRWLLRTAAAADAADVIFLDAPPPESDPLTEELLGVADVLLMVLSHDAAMQSRAIEDLRGLTNSAAGRPVLDSTQVRLVYSCLNGDVKQADMDRAREKFDEWLWVGHVPYHQAVWRGGNAGDLFGAAPAKVMAAADGIARQVLGVLAGAVPPKERSGGFLRRRARHEAPAMQPEPIRRARPATAPQPADGAVSASPYPPSAAAGFPPPQPESLQLAPAPAGVTGPPTWPTAASEGNIEEQAPDPVALGAPDPAAVPATGPSSGLRSRSTAVLEVFANPLPKITWTVLDERSGNLSTVPVPEGVATVTPFLLASKGRPQDIDMLARSGAMSRAGKRWAYKSWDNLYKTPEKSPAGAIAVKVNSMLTLEPGVVTDYQLIAELVAGAHEQRRPIPDRVELLNAAVHQLATLAGEAYGGADGAASREWAWAHEHDWLDGRNTPVLLAQSSLLNAACDAATAWDELSGEQSACSARVLVAMLLRLDGVVLPQYAPWVLMRPAATAAVGEHGSHADRTQVVRRVQELVAGGEPPDEEVIRILGL